MNQTWENGNKKNYFGPVLAQIWSPKIFFEDFTWIFLVILNIATSYHCMQFQRKLINQTWKNGKKTYNHFHILRLFNVLQTFPCAIRTYEHDINQ